MQIPVNFGDLTGPIEYTPLITYFWKRERRGMRLIVAPPERREDGTMVYKGVVPRKLSAAEMTREEDLFSQIDGLDPFTHFVTREGRDHIVSSGRGEAFEVELHVGDYEHSYTNSEGETILTKVEYDDGAMITTVTRDGQPFYQSLKNYVIDE
jgi:hypothetical protein